MQHQLGRPKLRWSKSAKDFVDLLSGTRDHLTEYLYENVNDGFDRLTQERSDYYITYSDIELIHAHGNDIKNIIGENCHFIELGPGYKYTVEQKTVTLLKNFQSILSYQAVDRYYRLAQEATDCVKLTWPTTDVCAYKRDMLKSLQLKILKEKSCMLFWGSTFSNFSDIEIDKAMNNISKSLKTGDHLIYTMDCCQSKDMIRKAYNSRHLRDGAKNIFHFFKFKLKIPKFDSDAFQFKYLWDRKNLAAVLRLISTKEQSFEFQGQMMHIPKGQAYGLIKSRKFSHLLSNDMLSRHGFKTVKTFSHETSNVTIFVAQKL